MTMASTTATKDMSGARFNGIGSLDALSSSDRYTINLYLKTLSDTQAQAALKDTDMAELYRLGRKKLDTKLRTARLYYTNVVRGMVTTDNQAYNSTIVGGLGGFFRTYKPDTGADEINMTADYPVCNPMDNLEGVEFIQRYLEALKLENDFCALFPAQSVEHLLHCYHPNTKELIFNIFEQVLTSAIGCGVQGKSITELHIDSHDAAELWQQFSGLSQAELLAAVSTAAQKVSKELDITSSLLEKYIDAALPAFCVRLYADLASGKAGRAFIVTG
ncbi:MAG: DUF6179 domain-containing protein [Angelakisella sp.]